MHIQLPSPTYKKINSTIHINQGRMIVMVPSIFHENLFDEFFGDPFAAFTANGRDPLYGKNAKHLMKTDVRELENSYEVAIDLPGFKKEEIKLDLENGYLTVAAAKSLDKDETTEEGRYIRRERYAGSLSRTFYIGDIRPEDVKAKFENGMLILTLPKAAPQALPKSNAIAIE